MRGEDLRGAVGVAEAADGEIVDEARAVDAGQNLIAFFVGMELRPAVFHAGGPEYMRAFEDQAVGADFDLSVEFDRLVDNEPVEDGRRQQAQETHEAVVNRRRAEQQQAFRKREHAPENRTAQEQTPAQVEILVGQPDAAIRCQAARVVEIGAGSIDGMHNVRIDQKVCLGTVRSQRQALGTRE